MSPRLVRLAPLSGVVFAVLSLAGMLTAQVPPGITASGEKVLAFSKEHASGQKTADLLLIAGFAFFVLSRGRCARTCVPAPVPRQRAPPRWWGRASWPAGSPCTSAATSP